MYSWAGSSGMWMQVVNVLLVVGVAFLAHHLYRSTPDVPDPPFRDIEGWTAPGWRKVAEVFRASLRSGQERGAAFAVYHQGELVVEVRGGYANWEAQQPWQQDTLSLYLSSSKGVLAVIVARLVQQGFLSYDDTVAQYWPEFAQRGKENITVKQLMTHQSGLLLTDEVMTPYILRDEVKLSELLARQAPYWTPGSHIGYQVWTHGLYVDQLIRRVDPKGRRVSQYFKEEIAIPFDIDFHFGMPRSEHHRAATIYAPSTVDELLAFLDFRVMKLELDKMFSSTLIKKILDAYPALFYARYNDPYMRELHQPSYIGYGTGRSLAKFYSLVLSGQGILSRKSLQQFVVPTVAGWDEVLRQNHENALGMVLRNSTRGNYMFGHPGAGGHTAFADLENNLSLSYVTNFIGTRHWGDDKRYLKLEAAVYECLQELKSS